MYGSIMGYKIREITSDNFEGEQFLKELEEIDENIKEKLISAISEDDFIIGLVKDNILKCVYIFKKQKEKLVLIFTEMICVKEISDAHELLKKFESKIIEQFKGLLTLGKIEKVEWNDMYIVIANKGKNLFIPFSVCIVIGIVLGLIYDDLLFGVILGALLGSGLAGTAVVKKKTKIVRKDK